MNILKCSDNNINKFSFMSRKGVYTQENMDEGENFNETSLSKKKRIIVTQIWKILQIQITIMQNEFAKILK